MTPTQFAAKTRNLAKSTGLNAQLVQRHFMMDRLIEQISESKYKNDFILIEGQQLISIRHLEIAN